MKLLVMFAVALLPAVAHRLWWVFFGRPRFSARCEQQIEHAMRLYPMARCRCSDCDAFREEMGWPP